MLFLLDKIARSNIYSNNKNKMLLLIFFPHKQQHVILTIIEILFEVWSRTGVWIMTDFTLWMSYKDYNRKIIGLYGKIPGLSLLISSVWYSLLCSPQYFVFTQIISMLVFYAHRECNQNCKMTLSQHIILIDKFSLQQFELQIGILLAFS